MWRGINNECGIRRYEAEINLVRDRGPEITRSLQGRATSTTTCGRSGSTS